MLEGQVQHLLSQEQIPYIAAVCLYVASIACWLGLTLEGMGSLTFLLDALYLPDTVVLFYLVPSTRCSPLV